MKKPSVVIGLLGTTLDAGKGPARWERWRPTVALCGQQDFVVSRLELLYPRAATALCGVVSEDIASTSPETVVQTHMTDIRDPWDFGEVYTTLYEFARAYPFDPEREDYYVHITTGTHVAQICLFLLTEARYFPAKLLQSSPENKRDVTPQVRIIDLDLSQYDAIASRARQEHTDNVRSLKSGIATRNPAFNRLIEQLEHVAANSVDPILLMGPTGAGKSQLAARIFELKKVRHQFEGAFVEVNCATLRGEAAMSALFGHRKGSFTGALQDRPGLLRAADGGLLFLDEIGELGLDEQAMLLRALEEKRFLPLGADREVSSNFLLVAGTNRDLPADARAGRFREDLLTRINLWTFRLPALRERREDIEPNLDYEVEQVAKRNRRIVRFSTEARSAFLKFAVTPEATWSGNFRDLSAAVSRLATLSSGGRITVDDVEDEVVRLRTAWHRPASEGDILATVPGLNLDSIDLFDRVQLAQVVTTCRETASLSEAGRMLFAASRARRASVNDADRLRKYLARFGLDWDAVRHA